MPTPNIIHCIQSAFQIYLVAKKTITNLSCTLSYHELRNYTTRIPFQKDHETAASAVRNLNNADVGGRPLRIDLADSDPFLEGKTTVRGELIDGGVPGPSEPRSQWRSGGGSGMDTGGRSADPNAFLVGLPPGISVPHGSTSLDTISQTLATMNPNQLMEVLAQMKVRLFLIAFLKSLK